MHAAVTVLRTSHVCWLGCTEHCQADWAKLFCFDSVHSLRPGLWCRTLAHAAAVCSVVRLALLQVALMSENGDTREDLTLPKGTEEAEKLAEQIKQQFGDGQELVVTVLKAMGEEMINSIKIVNQAS